MLNSIQNKDRILCRIIIGLMIVSLFFISLAAANAEPVRIEAESFAETGGVQINPAGTAVGWINDGDWVIFRQIDFGYRTDELVFSCANRRTAQGLAEIYTGAPAGRKIGQFYFTPTGSWQVFTDIGVPIEGTSGIHDLYIAFSNPDGEPGLGNIDYFEFTPAPWPLEPDPDPDPEPDPEPNPEPDPDPDPDIITSGQVLVTWSHDMLGVEGFYVYYIGAEMPSPHRIRIEGQATRHVVPALKYGARYEFWVQAFAGEVISEESPRVSVDILSPPGEVTASPQYEIQIPPGWKGSILVQ